MPTSGDVSGVNKVDRTGDTMTGPLAIEGAAAATQNLTSEVAGDTDPRFAVLADGTLNWGSGSAALDVALQRLAPNFLALIGGTFAAAVLQASASAANIPGLIVNTSGDATPRVQVLGNGTVEFGDGTNPTDMSLFRVNATTLAVKPVAANNNALFMVSASGAGFTAVTMYASGPTSAQQRWAVGKFGDLESGGNVGSSFAIQRLSDAGAVLSNNLLINRATGRASFSNNVTTFVPNLNDNGFSVATTPGQHLATFQGLNLGGATFGFFAVNKYYNGAAWLDMGLARLGSSFQIRDDAFTFFSFDTGNTPTARLTVASGGNVSIGTSITPAARLSFDASTVAAGGIEFGADTNLYRSAANRLRTDDMFVANLGIGVGNTAAATTLGSVTRRMEVFDAAGASLGFIPIYNSIT